METVHGEMSDGGMSDELAIGTVARHHWYCSTDSKGPGFVLIVLFLRNGTRRAWSWMPLQVTGSYLRNVCKHAEGNRQYTFYSQDLCPQHGFLLKSRNQS